jgi:hypothetical protein
MTAHGKAVVDVPDIQNSPSLQNRFGIAVVVFDLAATMI